MAVATRMLGLLGMGAVLTACASTPLVGPSYIRPSYDPSLVSNAAAYGGLKTYVVNNPFAASQEEVEGAVARTIESAHFGPALNLAPAGTLGERSSYKVVVLFNPAPGASAARLCENPNQATQDVAGETRVLAAFCSSSYRVSSTQGRIGQIASLDDPGFKALIRSVGIELFPPNRLDPGDNPFRSG